MITRLIFLHSLLILIGMASCSDSKSKKGVESDAYSCRATPYENRISSDSYFKRVDSQLGLVERHGFDSGTWGLNEGSRSQEVMFAGGLAVTYLNDDCWADIVFVAGDESGLVFYHNKGERNGFVTDRSLTAGGKLLSSYKRYTGVGIADIDGDYVSEIVITNLVSGRVVILSRSEGEYFEYDSLLMNRSTFGVSFSDIDNNGWLDMFLGHWSLDTPDGGAQALWFNNEGTLLPYDSIAGTSHNEIDQWFNFTPSFADFRNIGHQDLVIASDFGESMVLENNGVGMFEVVTDSGVISDENGMGGGVADFNNDGLLDWFVTSIFDPDGIPEGNWGISGNRLYMNHSSQDEIIFHDATELSGTRDGNWGWGVCLADFNNNGFVDIFHTNGFGYMPEDVVLDLGIDEDFSTVTEFIGVAPRLFMNNADGTFTDRAVEMGLDTPSEGRGVVCFDYDRDGDIDIALVDHSTGIQFFENQLGHGEGRRFLNIKLVGKAPNTDSIGAKIYLKAYVGSGHGMQSQMRVSQANSNFNSQNLPDIHFGLGNAEAADILQIVWPDDTELVCKNVSANQFLVFDQRDKQWPKFDVNFPDCEWKG